MNSLKLKELYTQQEFCDLLYDAIADYNEYVSQIPNSQEIFERFVFKPLYKHFWLSRINYDPSENGRLQFEYDLVSITEDVSTDFVVNALMNNEYFKEFFSYRGKDFSKEVISTNNPINQNITQSKTDTELANGTTAQNVGTVIYGSNVKWDDVFRNYYTGSKRKDLFKEYEVLFYRFYEKCEDLILVDYDVELDFSGDVEYMEFKPEGNEIVNSVRINRPNGLDPYNIKRGVNIAGVEGNIDTIGLKQVNVDFTHGDMSEDIGSIVETLYVPVPTNLRPENIKAGVNIAGVNGSIETVHTYSLSPNYADGDVNVNVGKIVDTIHISKPTNLRPENIKKNVTIEGITGTLEQGGIDPSTLRINCSCGYLNENDEYYYKGSNISVEINSYNPATNTLDISVIDRDLNTNWDLATDIRDYDNARTVYNDMDKEMRLIYNEDEARFMVVGEIKMDIMPHAWTSRLKSASGSYFEENQNRIIVDLLEDGYRYTYTTGKRVI